MWTEVALGATTGLAATAHCAGMCGAVAVITSRAPGGVAKYQLGRLASYTAAGFIAGGLGGTVLGAMSGRAATIVAWCFAGVLLVYAIRLAIPRSKPSTTVTIRRKPGRLSRLRALIFQTPWLAGILTPLLPCGVLYGALLVAAASGSAASGALLMFCFGSASAISLLVIGLASDRIKMKNRRAIQLLGAVTIFIGAVVFAARTQNSNCHSADSSANSEPASCHGHAGGVK